MANVGEKNIRLNHWIWFIILTNEEFQDSDSVFIG